MLPFFTGVNITATSVYPHPDATYALNITSYNSSSVNMTSFNSSAENITTYNSSSTKWIMCNNHTNMTTANMTSGNMTSNNMTSKMCHNLTSSLVSLTPSPVAKETCALRATCVVSTTCTACKYCYTNLCIEDRHPYFDSLRTRYIRNHKNMKSRITSMLLQSQKYKWSFHELKSKLEN